MCIGETNEYSTKINLNGIQTLRMWLDSNIPDMDGQRLKFQH